LHPAHPLPCEHTRLWPHTHQSDAADRLRHLFAMRLRSHSSLSSRSIVLNQALEAQLTKVSPSWVGQSALYQ
jgi:hypothetical protein